MTDFCFVIGTGRCGSTLIHELICRHDQVGFLSNIEDLWPVPPTLGRWNNPLLRRLPTGATEKGGVRFGPSEGYRALAREVSPVVVDPVRDLVAEDASPWLCASLERFFTSRAAAQGRPMFVHKFTGFPRAGFVARVFPSARFVHVVRDGRSVVLSWLRMPWWLGHRGPSNWQFGPLTDEHHVAWERSRRSFPVLAALAWVELMDAYDRAQGNVGETAWQEVSLEKVVASPVGGLRQLATALHLPFSSLYERQIRRVQFRPPATEPYKALVNALGEAEAARVQDILEPTLAAHGYA